MYFTEASLIHFRNYENEKVRFDPGVNLLTGDNAQGKTNLIEALYIMGLGRSFRTARDSELIAFGSDFARISTRICDPAEENREKEIDITFKPEGKVIQVDGNKLDRSMDLLSEVLLVIFSPEDLKMVKEGPEHRRRFLDREICQLKPLYFNALLGYRKVLRQRNALLKGRFEDGNLLLTYDEALLRFGLFIAQERKRFIEELLVISRDIHGQVSGGKEVLELAYEGDFDLPQELGEEEARERLLGKLHQARERDYERGFTTLGCHRDDLSIQVDGEDIRLYGSQGQQRTAALSMKLAEIRLIKQETGKDAILLLDDVLSELDEKRQYFLIDSMKEVQVFLTAAGLEEETLRRLPGGTHFRIQAGQVNRLT